MTGILYAARGAAATTSDLYTVDPVTAAASSVGAIGFGVTGLAFDPITGILYGATNVNSGASPKSLITIDPVTGAGTLVGGFGGKTIPDLAFTAAGVLYGWSSGDNKICSIDTATGAVTLLGASGISGSFGNGLGIDGGDGFYICAKGTNGDLYSGDLGTGAVTALGLMDDSGLFNDVQNVNAVSFDATDVFWAIYLQGRLATLDVPSRVWTEVGTGLGGGATWDALAWGPEEGGGGSTLGDGRVLIALDDTFLEPDPTWTRIDDTPNLVAGIDIHRGRQTELDQTETSTATVMLNDTDGLFDPANTGSPYFGSLDGKQIALQCFNPVTALWVTQYRGVIDDFSYDFAGAVNAAGEPLVATVALECVDLFDYLARVEMIPGTFGTTPPAGSEGVVFYAAAAVKSRIEDLLADASLAAARYSVFTGNVDVQSSKYDAGDSVLAAIRDAADAEFPGIANVYTDKLGRVVFHGRKARFDPETTMIGSDWAFTRWKAGDGTAVALDSDRAQIRPPLTWSRPGSRIINFAIAYPKFPITGGGGTFTEADIPAQGVVDTTSRDAYGYRAKPPMSDLLTLAGTTTMNDAKDETKLYATYFVQNYKDPHTRVESLTLRSVRPDDPRAAATWEMLVGADISDAVDLEHGYPGGVGLSESFFIEGSDMTIRPLVAGYDMVELTLNVSPDAYYATDVFV